MCKIVPSRNVKKMFPIVWYVMFIKKIIQLLFLTGLEF